VRLGTRGSALALAQAEWVAERLGGVEIVPIKTADGEVGDKARFVSAIESALLAGEVNLGVHSAKDVPAEMDGALALAGVPGREDPADAYVGEASSFEEIPEGARIGTASLRRRSQLLALRPDLKVVELRGNVDTRLRKLAEGTLEGIVLAAAGLRRLGRESEISFLFAAEQMTPAPGQGALILQARAGDEDSASRAVELSDESALLELTAERAAVRELEASCATPVGVLARRRGDELTIEGYAGLPDGSEWVRDTVSGGGGDAAELGRTLAQRMLAAGAKDILQRSSLPERSH
jgi:hydroxymethylbilane synthase